MKKIAVIGLGLIGGSLCKSLTKNKYKVYGYDKDTLINKKAIEDGSIIDVVNLENTSEYDIFLVSLYPQDVINFIETTEFKRGTIIVDMAGVKGRICSTLSKKLYDKGINFIGGHPMAGIERSGYDFSFEKLFQNASMILCVDEYTNEEALLEMEMLFLRIGFGGIKISNAKEHDEIIAYTSQLAHITSNAYVKSKTIHKRLGFSAGSFEDLTRVARLNPDMWAKLFLENKDNLLKELKTYILHLKEYEKLLEVEDYTMLYEALELGSNLKIKDEELNK